MMDKTFRLSPGMAMSDRPMSDRQGAEHAAATWIAKRDAGPWTTEDAAAFDAWLSASASHRAAYYRFNGAWQETGRLKALMAGNTASAFTGSANDSETPHRRFTTPRSLLALAATVVLTLGATFLIFQNHLLPRDD